MAVVSGISSASANDYQTSALADFRQTFMQMVKAIKSGDLSGAQQTGNSVNLTV